ncbi:AI-2E family transporter [Mycetocola zhadangensis]|uniref:AI-2E family transporter n=1 Tax=Mycetocola zhadangensis TaxID=1164595 RepID=A0A3L7ISP9_9MICO|nr:AI-2E family transporter [Mycetocola zhadangensis]RLQ81258.1 AI-2E family transporter [Mycetocola zhadangensis]GGF03317.1 AI-2E family transporter [Mycetocola zhadangensis]
MEYAPWPPGLRTLVALACGAIVFGALFLARDLAGPVLLAAVIVIICLPVRDVLDHRGMPSWCGSAAIVVVAYLVLAAMGVLLWVAATQFLTLVAEYTDEFQRLVEDVAAWLSTVGLVSEVAAASAEALDIGQVTSLLAGIGSRVLGVATALFFVLAYLIFMAADTSRYREAKHLFGAERPALLARIRRFTTGVRRYYVVNASFGLIVAVIDGLALWWLGVPAPLVWAILAFVTNFIPNIGFVLGVIPPAVLALVVGGPPMLLAVIAIYCVVNVVLQVLVQPKFVSDAVDITLTLSFFSVAFWTLIIGPLGAILSIPLTLLTRTVLLDEGPSARWLNWLSGNRLDGQEHEEEGGESEPQPLVDEQRSPLTSLRVLDDLHREADLRKNNQEDQEGDDDAREDP